MRTGIIAVASVVALLAGSAMAQTSPGSGGPGARPPGGATSQPAPAKQPVVNPLTAEDVTKIKGTNVYGSDDKKIGDVSTVLMDPKSKTIDRLVVNAGGVLGMGGHHVALPVDDFSWDGQHEGFKIGKNADELKAMPEWKEGTSTAAASSSAPSAGSSTPPSSSGATSEPSAGSASAPAASDAPKSSSESGDKK
jgi:sporulation protein YlmC with PRC-barrel domain